MVGRSTEQKALEQLFGQEQNQLVILYGRRGSGKSELIKEFCRDKKTMYYAARQASPKLQRQMLKEEIETKYKISISEDRYDTFFNRIRSGDSSKLVLVIQDFEHIAKKDEEFMASIGRLKDKKLYPGPVMIILCSSSIAWVEQDMVQCIGSCAKKVTGILKVKELGFVDVVHLLPKYGVDQCIQVYGILGGVLSYLRHWEDEKDLKTNVCKHILSRDGFLRDEAQSYIRGNLRELSVYNTILEAIASGRQKLGSLFQYTGYSRPKISVYLKNLMSFEVIERVSSFETGGWENAQKGVYQIKNTYIHFWYKFVYPHLSDLELLEPEEFYDAYIGPWIEEYLNVYFRKVCVEYLELMSKVKRLPISIHKIGTWVGKKGNIDIIAQNSVREKIVGLCNWSKEQLTYEMYQQLLSSMSQAKITAKKYYLFSAKDFDEAIRQEAERDSRLVLIDMSRL